MSFPEWFAVGVGLYLLFAIAWELHGLHKQLEEKAP